MAITKSNVLLLSILRRQNVPILDVLIEQNYPLINKSKVHIAVIGDLNNQVEFNRIVNFNNIKFSYTKNKYRMEILTELFFRHYNGEEYTCFFDDDFVFFKGNIETTIEVVSKNEIQLASISHHDSSYYNYKYTKNKENIDWQTTHFCEIGPILIFKSQSFLDLFPLDYYGMGWGLEAYWSRLSMQQSLKVALIHASSIVHLGKTSNFAFDIDRINTHADLKFYNKYTKNPGKYYL